MKMSTTDNNERNRLYGGFMQTFRLQSKHVAAPTPLMPMMALRSENVEVQVDKKDAV